MAAYDYPTPCDMPYEKYKPFRPLVLADRTWPDRQLTVAPTWCSVDLRDGNQALIDPMDPARKLAVLRNPCRNRASRRSRSGFPAASAPDFEFIRQIIEEDRIPDDVAIQVLVQCRADLIERTFEAVVGVPQAIIHFYNSTSVLQRRVVFGLDKGGITEIATSAARMVRKYAESVSGTKSASSTRPRASLAPSPTTPSRSARR